MMAFKKLKKTIDKGYRIADLMRNLRQQKVLPGLGFLVQGLIVWGRVP